jgi:hypothetical protein
VLSRVASSSVTPRAKRTSPASVVASGGAEGGLTRLTAAATGALA